ncbi:winged helix-turn-helix transcriptional regulator [Hyphomicrobium sp. 2TAF46]|uniref:winged helix-turn-helix transcriptional regulator n=1 Tax=Hyphomicrobium sp. 2TAF46 TaxID=3233019 RepID=UPI003F9052A8
MLGTNPLKRFKEEAEKQGALAANIYAEACPSRALLELVADKWTLLIMPALRRGPMRNGDLMRLIGGVSQKMLTQTLRTLESNGLVRRIDHMEVPPRVEYELTELGRSLADTIRKLDSWVEVHIDEVHTAREEFEKRERVRNR